MDIEEMLRTTHIVTVPLDGEEEDADVLIDVALSKVEMVLHGESVELDNDTVENLLRALMIRNRLIQAHVKGEHPEGACEICKMDENGMWIG